MCALMAKIACVYICAVVCICAYAMWAAGVMHSHEITGSSVCVRVPDVSVGVAPLQ